MQKQSYELITNHAKIGKTSSLIFNNRYPKVFFFLLVVPVIAFRLLRNRNIQMIHANDGLMAIFLTPFLLTKRRLSVTIHGLDIVFDFSLYQWWVKKYLAKFDLIVAVSEQTRLECVKRGIEDARTIYIPNAVELKKIEAPREGFKKQLSEEIGVSLVDKKILLSVGRPIKRKGFYWFLDQVYPLINSSCVYVMVVPPLSSPRFLKTAQKLLPKRFFAFFVKSIGLELDHLRLKQLIAAKDLQEKALLLPDKYLAQLYAHSDLFIMPNIPVKGEFEGFGLVLLEAASAGCLALAANIDGIPSAIQHNENGLLLPSENPKAWAEKVDELLGDELKKEQLSGQFKERVTSNQYSWLEMAKAYHKAFLEVA